MSTFYSTQETNRRAVPSVKNPVESAHGKLRVARFGYSQVAEGTAGDLIQLVSLPAGRCRLLGALSYMRHNVTVGSATMDLGWAAYVGLDGVAVVADPNGLDNNVSLETTGLISVLATVLAAVGNMKVFESQTGVIITTTWDGVPAASDYIYGDIVYVMD